MARGSNFAGRIVVDYWIQCGVCCASEHLDKQNAILDHGGSLPKAIRAMGWRKKKVHG